MRGNRDLGLVTIAAILCGLVASLVPWEVVRLVAAVPLAVLLPGYAVVAAAFGSRQLDPQRLTMLTLACGISVICLGGLVLNYLPGGLRTVTWALLLVAVVVVASLIAARRRAPTRQQARSWRWPKMRRLDVAFGLAALAAAVAALVLAYTPLPAGEAAGYTALWILPDSAGPAVSVRVGVVSAEQGSERYRLLVRAGKAAPPRLYRLALDPGEEQVLRVPVRLETPGSTWVSASLFEQADPTALYRRVTTKIGPGASVR